MLIQLHLLKATPNKKERYDVGHRILIEVNDIECIREREHGSVIYFKSGRSMEVYETYDFILSKKLSVGE